MPTGCSERAKEIFIEALENPVAERPAFLDRACGGDAALRAEVEKYLADHEQAGDFFAGAGIWRNDITVNSNSSAMTEGPGTIIGCYRLIQKIGEGGFGVVFMAEQETPVRRMVALKVIKLGMDTREVVARFEAERQALALLDHPNIAKVLDAGESATGRPYFVMELVNGIPVTEFTDRNKLSTEARLRLFMTICHALQHAHQKGIIHRDIKPGNVLVSVQDGVPKLIDFGIAKATQSRLSDKTLLTEIQQLIGTPSYMSPEQADRTGLAVDTRSDIYSLGVLLYELLTGTTPFDLRELRSAAYAELQRIIREVEPPKPSTRLATLDESITTIAANRGADPGKLRLEVRGELDWIVMKALEKDRMRRYDSAGDFARDIGRYLEDQPVEACPPSTAYLLRKFCVRNRNSLTLAAIILIVAVSAGMLYVLSLRAEQRKTQAALVDAGVRRNEAMELTRRALAAESQANLLTVKSVLRLAQSDINAGRRFETLDALKKLTGHCPPELVRDAAVACLTLADLRVLQPPWYGPNDGICFSHSGALFLDSHIDSLRHRNLIVYRVPVAGPVSRIPVLTLDGSFHVRFNAFSLDDRLIAVSKRDDSGVIIYSLDKTKVREFPGQTEFAFMPDGRSIAIGKERGPIQIYDLSSWEMTRQIPFEMMEVESAISPDGTKLASWTPLLGGKTMHICVLATGLDIELTTPNGRNVFRAAWHPDGNRIAITSSEGTIFQWDITDPSKPVQLSAMIGHGMRTFDLQYNNRGDLLASSIRDNTTCLWDPASGEQLVRLNGGGSVLFSPDDRMLMIAGDGGDKQMIGKHQIAQVAAGRERRTMCPPPGANPRSVSISPDGLIMACGGENMIRFWNLGDTEVDIAPIDLPMPQTVTSILFDADGAGLAAATSSGPMHISISEPATTRPTEAGQTRRLDIHSALIPLPHSPIKSENQEVESAPDDRPGTTVISASSHVKATSTHDGGLVLADSATGAKLVTLDASGDQTPAAFTADGGQLVTFGSMIHLWNLRMIRKELTAMDLDWPSPPIPPQKAIPRIELSIGEVHP